MRECLRTQTLLALETAESLTAEGLEAVAAGLARISDLVTETYLA
jgi:hypothetical protein